jgi:hypothetical protein
MRTRPNRILLLAIALPALLLALAPVAECATNASKETFYRCRDRHGQAYFGQNIPAECMQADVEVLDGTGRVVRVIRGPRSQEEAAALKAAEDAKRASAQRDRTLLATYLTVADIERLRDQRVEQLEQQARVTQQYILNLKERETRLMTDVQRFRPYSDSPKARPLPDHVAEDIVNTVNGLQVYEQQLTKNTAEQEKMRSEFASDIARFKELKGIM